MSQFPFPCRGEIWLVNFDPTIGAEIKKTRPALIISNNTNNQFANLVALLPISEKGEKVYPFEVAITEEEAGLTKLSKAKCQQIRTVDKIRLSKRIGLVSTETLEGVEQAIKIHLDF